MQSKAYKYSHAEQQQEELTIFHQRKSSKIQNFKNPFLSPIDILTHFMCSLSPNDLHKIFTKLDKKGDGLISIDQLNRLLERVGFPASLEELQAIVGRNQCLDSIDFFIFYDIVAKKSYNIGRSSEVISSTSSSSLDGDLAEAFKVFDLNGDGFISCEELENVLLRFGLWDECEGRDCKSMINKFDTNSDGLLDFEEFRNMMMVSSC